MAFWLCLLSLAALSLSQDSSNVKGPPLPDQPYKKWTDLWTYTDSCMLKDEKRRLDDGFADLAKLVLLSLRAYTTANTVG